MNDRTAGKNNDRLFCAEQVAKTNRLFRVSSVFAPRQHADRLLPVYALLSVIEQLGSAIADEDVARSKVNWWRMEFLHKSLAQSRHPVLQELVRTGAAQDLAMDAVAQLLDGAESRLAPVAPADMEELKNACIELQRPQFALEISANGSLEPEEEFDSGLLARNGILQLVRESTQAPGQGSFWWVPLNMLARHGISRSAVVANPHDGAVAAMMKEILSAGSEWGSGAIDRSAGLAAGVTPARHVFAITGLYSRKLNRLKKLTPDLYAAELGRVGVADLLHAWNYARRGS